MAGLEGQQGFLDQMIQQADLITSVASDEFIRGQLLEFVPNYVNSMPISDRSEMYGQLGIGAAAITVTQGRALVSAVASSSKSLMKGLNNFADAMKKIEFVGSKDRLAPANQRGSVGVSDGRVVRQTDNLNSNRVPESILADFPDARRVSVNDAIEIAGRENAGPNARKFDSWIDDGGDVFYDQNSNSFVNVPTGQILI